MFGCLVKIVALAMLSWLVVYKKLQIPNHFFVIYGFGAYISLNYFHWLMKEEHDKHLKWLNDDHNKKCSCFSEQEKEHKYQCHMRHHYRRITHLKYGVYKQYVSMILCAIVVIYNLQNKQ